MRSVVTLTVSRRSLSKIPLGNGEVLISPIIQCSFFQELLRPASISLPCCITSDGCKIDKDGVRIKLYAKLEPGKFGRRVFSSQTPSGFQISQEKITFSTRHLQLFTLSSTYIHGVRFTCEMSLTYSSNKPTLHVLVAHPYNGYRTAVSKRHETFSKLSYQATAVIKFNIESSEDDIKLLFLYDSDNAFYIRVPVHCLLGGGCHSSTFDLSPSTANDKKFKACLHIDQGASTLAQHQFTILKEAQPDYAISPTRDRQRFASDYMLEVLSDLVGLCDNKDARELGYKLGFSYSSVKKYLVRTESSARSVSRSALIEMLMDWRRCVRPSEQVEKLKLALDAAGLRHEAEILFDKK
ncbi:uncharacterized protein LOC121412455 [Lytechinus variegatus]|uniref:uncharacterized protein LOC121412455 n=1 Tax=Lytechinus variegatus TaxID=7654 RepID=UPI001BB29894|nr:uncharacterized protein LOC121412455 [Lytechinus variegatus]